MSAHASPHTTTTAAAASTRRRRAESSRCRQTATVTMAERPSASAPERDSDSSNATSIVTAAAISQAVRGSIACARRVRLERMIRRGVLRSGAGRDVSEAEGQRHDRPRREMVAVDERPEGQRALELGPEAPVDIPSGRRRLRDRQERHGKAHRRYRPDRLAHAAAPEERARDEEERGRAQRARSTPSRCRTNRWSAA